VILILVDSSFFFSFLIVVEVVVVDKDDSEEIVLVEILVIDSFLVRVFFLDDNRLERFAKSLLVISLLPSILPLTFGGSDDVLKSEEDFLLIYHYKFV
jgi:hypothetical protein